MDSPPTDSEALLTRLDEDGIEHLWVVYHDYGGRAAAKTLPREGFRSAVRDGVVFALANLNMAADDHQAVGATLLADSGDFLAVPDPRSYAVLPRFPRTARCHAWMRSTDGSEWDGCPRTRLAAVMEELGGLGYTVQAALEPEFYLLRGGQDAGYKPANATRMFSQEGLAAEHGFVGRVVDELRSMGVTVAQLGKEYGPGQYEMSVRHADPIRAVDDYFSLKEAVRDLARDQGYVATFMPKPYAHWAGCSLHVHLSLWDLQGEKDLTASDRDETSLSDAGSWFLGGILRHVDALTGLGSPTVNSYKRLQPGSWAPANSYWGYGNRSGVVRIPGAGKRRHLEFRSPDNSCQPFLLLAGLLGAGVDGIRNRVDPPPPFEGDIGHLTPEEVERHGITYLPRTLPDALAALEADEVVTAAVGPTALGHFLTVKRHELAVYETVVHPWERETYLEIV
ncbi:MAG: glutamine synthetase family protein [Chloroflexota bacterium]|nr:glutamine synthetase family protein [Chloroflexota bacterium]